MAYFGRQNCQHLDNWNHCKVHAMPWWIRWLHPKGRPPCILDLQRDFLLQDEVPGCPDQKPYPRPSAPKSGSGVMPPAKND
jgi:hypothetical protein